MRRSAAVFTALVLLLTAAVAAPFFVGADPDLLMIIVPFGMFAPFVAALATWMLVAGRRPAFGEAFATRRFGPGLLLALGVFVAIAALQPVIGTALGIAEWRSPADPVGVGLALVAQFAIMLVASIGDEHLVAPVEGAARLAWLAIVWLLALAAAFALVGARRRPAGSFSASRTSDGLQRVRITAVEQG